MPCTSSSSSSCAAYFSLCVLCAQHQPAVLAAVPPHISVLAIAMERSLAYPVVVARVVYDKLSPTGIQLVESLHCNYWLPHPLPKASCIHQCSG